MALTHRELQVLQYLADGKTPKEIGLLLCIHRTTVFTHIRNVKDKLNASSREEAVAHGCFIGLVAPVHRN